MASSIENDIRKMLRQGKTPGQVAQSLTQKWRDFKPTLEDIKSITAFLLNAGFYPQLAQLYSYKIAQFELVSWDVLAATLTHFPDRTTNEIVEAIVDGATKMNQMDRVLSVKELESFDPRITQIRHQATEWKKGQRDRKKKNLLDKISFLRSQRMIEQEKDALSKLIKLDPNDVEAIQARKDFDERWAREIISRRSHHAKEREKFEMKLLKLPEELLQSKKVIFDQVKTTVQKKPHLAKDLSLMFYLMGLFEEALHLQQFDPQPDEWYRLDLYLETRNFVLALEEAKRLEKVYQSDSEASFAAAYVKAKALWGLGEHSMAIEIVNTILKIRPDYRSAQSLLVDWQGDEL